MAEPRQHLAHAPIVEAALDVRVRAGDGAPGDLASAPAQVGAGYSERIPVRRYQHRVHFGPGAPRAEALQETPDGFQARDPSRHRALRWTKDGFTFSQLAPYPSWEVVLAEAQRLWPIYCAAAAPAEISRLGLRFINRLELPGDVGGVLVAPPAAPPPVPQAMQQFLSRVVVYDGASGASVAITQAMEPGPGSPPAALLDIDVFRAVTLDPADGQMWAEFERFRRLKNQAFFASITEEAARAYE